MAERIWNILAILLCLASVVFLWWNNLPVAFVLAALGLCAWFISYRSRLRATLADEDKHSDEDKNEN